MLTLEVHFIHVQETSNIFWNISSECFELIVIQVIGIIRLRSNTTDLVVPNAKYDFRFLGSSTDKLYSGGLVSGDPPKCSENRTLAGVSATYDSRYVWREVNNQISMSLEILNSQ